MSDILGYSGRICVVTGCASGMGKATAQLLLELGAQVHGLDFQPADLPLASFNMIDLRQPQSISDTAAKLPAKIDALFNCAGLGPTFSPLDIIKVNFIGLRDLTEKLLPRIAKGGGVASVASTAGMGWSRRVPDLKNFIATKGFDEAVAWAESNAGIVTEGYSFSKEAVIVWTFLQSQLHIEQGVRINCTMPSTTQTPMLTDQIAVTTPAEMLKTLVLPMGRPATAQEQAFPLVTLNSPLSSYVNGVVLNVDGGRMASFTAAAK